MTSPTDADLVSEGLSCSHPEVHAQTLWKENERLRQENGVLRELLWANHGHTGLYGDDGEMQCNLTSYQTDFKRNSVAQLEFHLNPLRAALTQTANGTPPTP